MVRGLLVVLVFACLVLAMTSKRNDVAADADVPVDTSAVVPEPTTEAPVQPLSGGESPLAERFQPSNAGPSPQDPSPAPLWQYEDLTLEEQTDVDRGRDTDGWREVHDAFGAASAERARNAAGDSAQSQLGVDALATTGVVP